MSIESHMSRPRPRDVGLRIGQLASGVHDAITDVAGVQVGQVSVVHGDGPLRPGEGPARTGVTVIVPHPGNVYLDKVPAAIEVINGFGKPTGLAQVDELGTIETPIALTSTLCAPRVADALITAAIRATPAIGVTTSTVNPVVGECSDAWLNDIQGRHVGEAHLLEALANATTGPVAGGNVGAGVGMTCFGYKGGIGTASRMLPTALGGWTVGALVLANFGTPGQLVIDGVPVGRLLLDGSARVPERGSIMMIIATDAPLLDRALRRIARRTGFGLARTGSMAGHGSGDIAIAFSTASSVRMPHAATGGRLALEVVAEQGPDASSEVIDALFAATIEATEASIIDALFRAETLVGRDFHRREALPLDAVLPLLRAAGRID